MSFQSCARWYWIVAIARWAVADDTLRGQKSLTPGYIVTDAKDASPQSAAEQELAQLVVNSLNIEGVQADAIIFIKGRIAFAPPVWYRPAEGVTPPTSAGFGAAILVFDKNIDPQLKAQDGKYVSRAWLQVFGEPLAASAAADRAAWVESFETKVEEGDEL